MELLSVYKRKIKRESKGSIFGNWKGKHIFGDYRVLIVCNILYSINLTSWWLDYPLMFSSLFVLFKWNWNICKSFVSLCFNYNFNEFFTDTLHVSKIFIERFISSFKISCLTWIVASYKSTDCQFIFFSYSSVLSITFV
jgi:hypothetical protein